MYESDQSNLEPQPPEESNNNRTFLIAAGILGGIVLLSIACLAGYALLFLPGQQKANQQAASANATQNAAVAFALTSTVEAAAFPTATVTPSQTPVVAEASPTNIPVIATNTQDPATATVAAALTLAAQAQLTHVPTSTALPGTGIGDQYGAPGLVIVGMALIVVIFLARRLRATPTR